MMQTIETLGAQHRAVLARLDEIEAGRPAGPGTLAEVHRFLAGEVADHFALEEAALFPVLARYPHLEAGPLAVMDDEHREFRRLLDRLAAALREAHEVEQAAIAREIAALLRDHIAKEDQVLFPIARDLLSPAEQAEVDARAAALGAGARSSGSGPP